MGLRQRKPSYSHLSESSANLKRNCNLLKVRKKSFNPKLHRSKPSWKRSRTSARLLKTSLKVPITNLSCRDLQESRPRSTNKSLPRSSKRSRRLGKRRLRRSRTTSKSCSRSTSNSRLSMMRVRQVTRRRLAVTRPESLPWRNVSKI